MKDGLQVRWHDNGNKQEEMRYRNGKLHGKWTICYDNENKAEEDRYEDGHANVQQIEWYEIGQKKKECSAADDDVPHWHGYSYPEN